MPSPHPTLVREVEYPHRRGAMWGPILSLVAAGMVMMMTAVAVTARPPRRAPEHRPQVIDNRQYIREPMPVIGPVIVGDREHCTQRVYRATDGRPEQFEDCVAQPRR
jgi:hypothetical protein